jgi:hypothetical protein
MVCPECGEIPNLIINHENFKIQCNCLNGHSKEYNLNDFIRKSREKVDEDNENIQCSECKKKIHELENKEKDMYFCNCKKYFCNECKEKHKKTLDEDEESNHNLVINSEKDYRCTCSKSLEDYLFYCNNCNKNLCQECENEHRKNHHSMIDFSDEIVNNLMDDLIEKKK